MGKCLRQLVIAKAGLKKEEFKTVDKQGFTYSKQHITLDGCVDTNVSFENKHYYLCEDGGT